MNKQLHIFLLLLGMMVSGNVLASSHCMLKEIPLQQRAEQATAIIEGEVLSQYSFWDATHSNIYTSNRVKVYKVFKGQLTASEIEIITEGGTVGLDRQTYSATLELKTGQTGIFFCIPHNVKGFGVNSGGLPSYMVYSSMQGFIEYNETLHTAHDPFEVYRNVDELQANIASLTGTPTKVISNYTGFATTSGSANKTTAVPSITSFTPAIIRAGTNDTLTITGTNFGATRGTGFVGFRNADDGGASFMIPLDTHYVSWTDTEIKVLVPSSGLGGATAGTGKFIVVNSDPNVDTSNTDLTVIYSISNVAYQSNTYIPYHISDNGNGGYSFLLHTDFANNTAATASFMRALTTWCATAINWDTAGTTIIDVIAADNTNVVRFDNGGELPVGVLGRCTSRYQGCAGGGTFTWYVNELDVAFDDGTNWEYGPALPSFSEYDFESVAVHELGHGHQLSHVIDFAAVMNFAIANGQTKRTLSATDITAGAYVMGRNVGATPCGQSSMTLKVCTPLALDLLSFTGEYVSGTGVELNWEITNEKLTDKYIVQRSSNGKNFEDIGSVNAVDAIETDQYYSYTDRSVSAGKWYYRLMQVGINGEKDFSNVLTIEISNRNNTVSVYPNPARDYVNIAISSDQNLGAVTIELTDINGKLVVAKTYTMEDKAGHAVIEIATLMQGVYFYNVKTNNTSLQRGKIVITE